MGSLTQLNWLRIRRYNELVARSERDFPGMPEAAMVYVGDVYALRELDRRSAADGWGSRQYSCDSEACCQLP